MIKSYKFIFALHFCVFVLQVLRVIRKIKSVCCPRRKAPLCHQYRFGNFIKYVVSVESRLCQRVSSHQMCCNSYQKTIDVKVFLSCDDKKPQPGDLIEISRGLYAHWAVYVGDGFVVHFGVPGKSFTQLTHLTPPYIFLLWVEENVIYLTACIWHAVFRQ